MITGKYGSLGQVMELVMTGERVDVGCLNGGICSMPVYRLLLRDFAIEFAAPPVLPPVLLPSNVLKVSWKTPDPRITACDLGAWQVHVEIVFRWALPDGSEQKFCLGVGGSGQSFMMSHTAVESELVRSVLLDSDGEKK